MLGFAVLLLASMSPLRTFGGIMVASMFLAAFSALTILPALLLRVKMK
jgi:predicted RND superfamily exporter protein